MYAPAPKPHFYIEVQSGTENIFADGAGLPRLGHRFAHDFEGVGIFSAHVNVTLTRAYGMGGDNHPFDRAVRVILHENAIFEGAGLGFVGVAHDVLGLACRLRGSFPLDAGGKCRAAAADQPRNLQLRDHILRPHRHGFFQSGVTAAAAVIGKRGRMTLTAVGGQDADVAADEADRFTGVARTDLRCLAGIAFSRSDFSDKERRGVIAQTQTGSMLDGELTVRADFARRNFQMAAQGVRQFIATRQGTDGRVAHARHGSTQRLAGEHLVEIDDAEHVGEGNAQGAAHLGRNGFGDPAMELLCGMQGRQKRGSALRRQLGEHRAQGIEFAVSHLSSRHWCWFNFLLRDFFKARPWLITVRWQSCLT